jgi:hypothetical protein
MDNQQANVKRKFPQQVLQFIQTSPALCDRYQQRRQATATVCCGFLKMVKLGFIVFSNATLQVISKVHPAAIFCFKLLHFLHCHVCPPECRK